jgi:hypothetical protein
MNPWSLALLNASCIASGAGCSAAGGQTLADAAEAWNENTSRRMERIERVVFNMVQKFFVD